MESIVSFFMMGLLGFIVWKICRRIFRRRKEARELEEATNKMKLVKAQRYLDWVARQEVEGRENEVTALMDYMEPKLGQKYKIASLGEYTYAYCFSYYPKGRIQDEDPVWASNRQMVYDFKIGNYQTAAVLMVDFLRGRYTRGELQDVVLCVIPASTMEKNERRYRRFCEYVCAKTGIRNGMDFIRILYDRENSREAKSENTILNLSFSDEVAGLEVLLFDDIMTRGTSFIQCARRLMENEALSVTGFFLGKTIER